MRELYEEMRCILKLLAVTVGLYPLVVLITTDTRIHASNSSH